MYRPITLLFPILLTIVTNGVFAQDTSNKVNQDPEAFAGAIEDKFGNLQSSSKEAIVEKFIDNWETGQFNVDEQNLIFEVESLMDQNQFRVSKGYSDYLGALNASRNKKLKFKKFKQWHNVLKKMVNERRDFNQVNQTLTHLYKHNYIYKSRSKNWEIDQFQYELSFDKKPYLKISEKTNLSCITQGDTLKIYNTTGKYDIVQDKWQGNSGKLTWERVGLNPNKVFAEFDKYSMRLKPGEIKVNGAQFFNKNLFNKPLKGKIEDKVYIAEKGKDAQFPQFYSDKVTHKIDGFFENISYVGGYTMKGRKVIGTGSADKDARIEVYYNGVHQLLAKSNRFLIEPDAINASKTSTSIYFKEDSIYHSNIRFKYQDEKNKVILSKPNEGLGQSPFYDSYHKMEIDVDVLEWNIDKPFASLRMTLNSVESGIFRSDQYYDKGEFDKIQGILEKNPLKQLHKYANRFNTYRIGTQEIADFFGIPLQNMQKILFRLSKKGFVNYYTDEREFVIQNKLTHYIESNKNLKDFDNIELESETGNNINATLDFNSGSLELKGVESTPLSVKQNVRIYPRNQELTIKKNRDMEFDGQMTAGRFHYFGDDFKFDYDSFKVDLKDVDSMLLYYPDEATGELVKVNNVLQDISGSVFIDHPNNKSGRADLTHYPVFDCTEESAVYYEKPSIFNRVYKKDSFYFQVDPFKIDSLNNFTRKGIQFGGTFYSADIFPVFDHSLTLMKDNSLGFTKRTPTNGYPLYTGKGKGYMQIKLSNQGLWGKGRVKYETSETESQNFLFFPDSMNSHSESFTIPKEGQNRYPAVTGKQVYNHWVPYKDSMYIREKEPLSVYNEDVKFKGDLILTPQELYGTGTVEFDRAVINSKALALNPNNIKSDSASFKLKSDERGKPSFFTSNTSLNLDLQNQKLDGTVNSREAKINLQKHQYETSIKDFSWDIEDQSVYMKTPPDQSIEDAFMLSTDPNQDSLQFNTTAAFFDLEKSVIEARNIPHINIADAQVYPKNGQVTIKENSKLKTLRDARIRTDTTYFFHDFYDATINVISQSEYGATGKYNYEDRNGNKDTILFDKIRVDAENRTVAEGVITEQDGFNLSPRFQFEGTAYIKAWRQELAFKGLILPENIKPTLRTEKIQFADTVNPDSIYINVDKAVNEGGDRLYTGVYMDQKRSELYNLFMGTKKNPNDYPLFKATGFLHYSYYTGKYKTNKEANLNNVDSPLHEFTYSDQDHSVKTRGDINLNFDNENFSLNTAGSIEYKQSDTAHTLDVAMEMDFNFNPEAIQIIADTVNNLSFYRPDTKDDRDLLKNVLPNLVESPEAKTKIQQNLREFDMMVTHEDYQPTFLFSRIQLQWNPERKAFINQGNLGLASIKDNSINKQLKGKMAFKTGITNDQIRFFMGATQGSYHYFNIGNEYCKVFSSDFKFNQKVNSTAGDFSENDFEIKVLKDGKEKLFFQRSFNQ